MFNSSKFIEQSVLSVQSQSFSNWELILVDDASNDNTLKIVTALAKKDKRIRIYRQKHNSGAAATRNLGTEKAKGNYIAFLDADDLWHKNKLSQQLEKLKESDICFGSYELIDQKGSALKIKVSALTLLDFNKLLKANYIGNLTGIYNAEVLGKIFTKNLRKRQDWLLWLEALKRSDKPAIGIKDTIAYYRVGKHSLSSSKLNLIKYNYSVYRKGLGLGRLKSFTLLLNFFVEHFFVKRRLIKSIA